MRFNSDYSLWWLFPILLISIGISFFFYSKQSWLKELSKTLKIGLITLRASVLFLILFLVLGILFQGVNYRTENPILLTVFDNSNSMLNYKDSSKVKNQISDFRAKLKEKFGEKYETQEFQLGSDFKPLQTLDFLDRKSNLSNAFETIHKQFYKRNIGGIIFVSDGNYNEGSNPIYAAEKMGLTPIFTLGVGDTLVKKDLLVRDVASNEIAFLNNKFPIEVDVEASKMGKINAKVNLIHHGKIIDSKSVEFKNGEFDYAHIRFELDAKSIGFQQYIVEIEPKSNEYTLKNNRKSVFVEILDARNKVLILGQAPHPDMAALKSVLATDENLSVESILLENWDKKLDKVDLIIWHEPGVKYSAEIHALLEKSGLPIFYFIGPNTSNAITQKLGVGLQFSNSRQLDEVQGKLNKSFKFFELRDEMSSVIASFPPVTAHFGEMKLASQNTILLYQSLGTIQKKEALLFFGNKGARKYGVFFGEGIWRWKIHEFAQTQRNEVFNELFQRSLNYLLIKQNGSALRVSLPKRITSAEDLKVKAEFYDASMQLTTKAKIRFELLSKKGKSIFQFAPVSNFYELPLGKLNEGEYSWKAIAEYDGKKHLKTGQFIVEELSIEALDTRANHTVLYQLAEKTNAQFFPLHENQKVIDAIDLREDITPISYEESTYKDLIDYFWILILLVLLLSFEWFLKRRNGAY